MNKEPIPWNGSRLKIYKILFFYHEFKTFRICKVRLIIIIYTVLIGWQAWCLKYAILWQRCNPRFLYFRVFHFYDRLRIICQRAYKITGTSEHVQVFDALWALLHRIKMLSLSFELRSHGDYSLHFEVLTFFLA
jgi:hypothetical protein